MNKTLAFALMLVSSSVSAESDLCIAVSRTAEQIMLGRQSGVLMEEQVASLSSIEDLAIKKMFNRMIIAAYEIPKQESKELRESAITEFRNKTFLQCNKSLLN